MKGRREGSLERLMGTEVQFGKMKKFWRMTIVLATQGSECA
jgi:hypothetical protein